MLRPAIRHGPGGWPEGAGYSSVARSSIIAKTCKKEASKSPIRMQSRTAPAVKASQFNWKTRLGTYPVPMEALHRSNRKSHVVLDVFAQQSNSSFCRRRAIGLHLQNLRFFVLEVIVDGFHETIGQLLHLFLDIAKTVFGQLARSFQLFCLVESGPPIGAHTHTRFLSHFAQGTHQLFASLF